VAHEGGDHFFRKVSFQNRKEELIPGFYRENRILIFPWKSIPDFFGSLFNRDHDRDYHLKIGIRFEKRNR